MKLSLLPLLAIATLGLGSCDKDDCDGGTDGDVNIVTFAVHNGDTLRNYAAHPDTAFVKFNAISSPGTSPSNFDTYFVGDAGEDHIHIEDLECGNYFIYRTAFDSVANKTYTGSTYVNVPEKAPDAVLYINVN